MIQQRPEKSGLRPKTKIENRHHFVLARHEPLMSRAYTLISQALITRTGLSTVYTVVRHVQHRNDNASRTLVDQVWKKPQLGRLNIAILRKFSRVGQVSLRPEFFVSNILHLQFQITTRNLFCIIISFLLFLYLPSIWFKAKISVVS